MKVIGIIIIAVIINVQGVVGQEVESQDSTKVEVFSPVEVPADFPGGLNKFFKYIDKNMQHKDIFEKQGFRGRVMIQFVIDKDGSIEKESVQVINGINKLCDDEAIRLIKNSPNWIPAEQNGKKVKMRMMLPITFG